MRKYRQFCSFVSVCSFLVSWAALTAEFGFLAGLILGSFASLCLALLTYSIMMLPARAWRKCCEILC